MVLVRHAFWEPFVHGDGGGIVVKEFESVASKISTPVLLQVLTHFKKRNDIDFKVFFPKGNVAKAYGKESFHEIFDEVRDGNMQEVVIFSSFIQIYNILNKWNLKI